MNTTEKVIFEQFPYWEKAIGLNSAIDSAELLVFVGCGTSFNLALSLAAYANMAGRKAIAVPGADGKNAPRPSGRSGATRTSSHFPEAARRRRQSPRQRQAAPPAPS